MRERGLERLRLAVPDTGPGLPEAPGEFYPAAWPRCVARFCRNVPHAPASRQSRRRNADAQGHPRLCCPPAECARHPEGKGRTGWRGMSQKRTCLRK
ncbi:hypothetical protein [uncultured Desulfovibrio sp.]|uniref:hypothetical protein n=1 Tax=uncultured Desulfovibrio sp. TaxID=167968 RepID=UPI00345BD98A